MAKPMVEEKPVGPVAVEQSSLLDQIVEQGRFTDSSTRERGKSLIKEFVSQVLEGSMTIGRDADQMITARVAQIDHLISLQLNEVLHNPQFQKLEGTWRGLKYLLDQSETSTQLKIRILNASKKELLRDLQRAPEFDQSAMFKKVYEDEYGIFGGGAYRRFGRRLRVQQASRRHGAAGKSLSGGSCGSCSVSLRSLA